MTLFLKETREVHHNLWEGGKGANYVLKMKNASTIGLFLLYKRHISGNTIDSTLMQFIYETWFNFCVELSIKQLQSVGEVIESLRWGILLNKSRPPEVAVSKFYIEFLVL